MNEILKSELIRADASRIAELALAEDGPRDITSLVTISESVQGTAHIEARSALVMAGTPWADAIVSAVGLPAIEWNVADGDRCTANSVVGIISGPLRQILRAERPLLNLLQRAAGIATLTAAAVQRVAGTGCVILHTRKTTPGLRLLEVHSVLAGGGGLHRTELASTVMVKDNHWQGLTLSGRRLPDALAEARAAGVASLQVEVENAAQLEAACDAGATRLLIDNQTPAVVREWSIIARAMSPAIEIEATGGITLDTLAAYAAAGADFISLGALTHSVPSADLGLELVGS